MEGDTITVQDIFKFELEEVEESGRVKGEMKATGIRPAFADKFALAGITAARRHLRWRQRVVTIILTLAAISTGAFVFTGALWATGFGSLAKQAHGRLDRLASDREEDEGGSIGRASAPQGDRELWWHDPGVREGRRGLGCAPRTGRPHVDRQGILHPAADACQVASRLLGLLFSPIPMAALALAPLSFLGGRSSGSAGASPVDVT